MFNNITAIKGNDKRPANGASVGRIGIGPTKKNLAVPKELEARLRKNDIMGHAWVMLVIEVGRPTSSTG